MKVVGDLLYVLHGLSLIANTQQESISVYHLFIPYYFASTFPQYLSIVLSQL